MGRRINKALNMRFSSFNRDKKNMSIEDVAKEIIKLIQNNKNKVHTLVIGSDSHSSSKQTKVVTAITLHTEGVYYKSFYGTKKIKREFNLYNKICMESSYSLAVVEFFNETLVIDKIIDIVYPQLGDDANFYFEVHVDIGKRKETRELIRYIRAKFKGKGVKVKIKPEAYGATCLADNRTRNSRNCRKFA